MKWRNSLFNLLFYPLLEVMLCDVCLQYTYIEISRKLASRDIIDFSNYYVILYNILHCIELCLNATQLMGTEDFSFSLSSSFQFFPISASFPPLSFQCKQCHNNPVKNKRVFLCIVILICWLHILSKLPNDLCSYQFALYFHSNVQDSWLTVTVLGNLIRASYDQPEMFVNVDNLKWYWIFCSKCNVLVYFWNMTYF